METLRRVVRLLGRILLLFIGMAFIGTLIDAPNWDNVLDVVRAAGAIGGVGAPTFWWIGTRREPPRHRTLWTFIFALSGGLLGTAIAAAFFWPSALLNVRFHTEIGGEGGLWGITWATALHLSFWGTSTPVEESSSPE